MLDSVRCFPAEKGLCRILKVPDGKEKLGGVSKV